MDSGRGCSSRLASLRLFADTESAEDVVDDLSGPDLSGEPTQSGKDASELLRDDLVGMALALKGPASFEPGEHFFEDQLLAKMENDVVLLTLRRHERFVKAGLQAVDVRALQGRDPDRRDRGGLPGETGSSGLSAQCLSY